MDQLDMFKFSFVLQQGEDVNTGLAVFGFEHDGMFIYDPFLSDCGRFQVDPVEAYGITRQEAEGLVTLNRALVQATEAAVDAACKSAQDAMGVESSDPARLYFSDEDAKRNFSKGVADYMQFELRQAGVQVE